MATDDSAPATEFSESLTQQGDKSAKRGEGGLLSHLSPPHARDSGSHALREGRREIGSPTRKRPWLDALRSVEEKPSKEREKRAARVLSSSVDEILEAPVHRSDKSAKSPTPSRNGKGTSGNATDVKPKVVQRRLVTIPEHLAEVVADLKGAGLVALDLETTGLNPRKDAIRLLSVARYESRNTKPPELIFSALLGNDGTQNVRFVRTLRA
jgi:hypothetical protein